MIWVSCNNGYPPHFLLARTFAALTKTDRETDFILPIKGEPKACQATNMFNHSL